MSKKLSKKKFNNYFKERYEKQLKWYDSRSTRYKRLSFALKISAIVSSPIIPVLALLDLKWATVVLSSILAILTGIINFCNFEEKWHSYRTTCETLRKEKYLYDYKVREYRETEDPEGLFVDRIESIISSEHTRWLEAEKRKRKKPND